MSERNDREKVLRAIIRVVVDWHDVYVISARSIAEHTGISKYKVLKILHELRDEELVERATQGCPAQVSYGEIAELICEAMPPLNGWTATKKCVETEFYKSVKDEYHRELAQWANGYEEEG